MTDEGKKGMKLKDLAMEDIRKLTPWDEIRNRYSGSVLYSALSRCIPEIVGDAEEARRQLVELNAKIGESEEKLKELNGSVTEAEEKRRVAEEDLGLVNDKRAEAEKEVKGLEGKRSALTSDLTGLKEESRKAIEDAKTTEEQLEEFAVVEAGLGEYGIDLKDAAAVDSVLRNIEKLGGDPVRIVDACRRVGDLGDEEKRLRELTATRREEAVEAEVTLTTLRARIAGSKELVDKISYIEAFGASAREVGSAIEAALRSAALSGYTTGEALASLTLDLGENYGVTRRLREELDLLERKRGNLERMISAGEKNIEAQESILKANEAALASLRWLNEAEVPNQEIVDIQRTMAEYEGGPQSFARAVKELGGLDAYTEEKRTNLRKLEAEGDQLSERIKDKQMRFAALNQSFVVMGAVCEENLNNSLGRIENLTDILDPKFDALMEKYYSTVDTRAEELLKRIDEALVKRNNTLAKMLTDFNGILNKTLEGIEAVSIRVHEAAVGASKLAGLSEVAQMMSGGNVSPRSLILRLHAILQQSSETLTRRGYARHAEALDEALEAMRKLDGPIDLQ